MKLNLGSIELTEEENLKLIKVAEEENRSMRNLISTIIKKYLGGLND